MSGRFERGVERQAQTVSFTFDGRPFEAVAGETVAAALWAGGQRSVRRSSAVAEARAPFCLLGICFECLVRVDGNVVRACVTPVRAGMVVETGGAP